MAPPLTPTADLGSAIEDAYPELAPVAAAAAAPVYLVGGAVRDLLLGRGRADIDLVVVGDAAGLAAGVGAEWTEHERFGTAKASSTATARHRRSPGRDLPAARGPARGAAGADYRGRPLAAGLHDQRDGDPAPAAARTDRPPRRPRRPRSRPAPRPPAGSFSDDPTRALRAARYAARFGFEPEPETAG